MLRSGVAFVLAVVLLGAATSVRATNQEELVGGRVLVVLGSSTAAGIGASSPAASWVGIVAAALRRRDPRDTVANLARPGLTTYSVMPFFPNLPTPRRRPNTEHNVDRALAMHPYAVVLNLPSNDTAQGIPTWVQKENFEHIASRVLESGVRLWVISTQPRNFQRPKRVELALMRDWLHDRFAPKFVDIWPDLADEALRLRNDVGYGDGTHLNDQGHAAVAQRVLSADPLERGGY